jgi:glutamate-5-semialdehyde dehydrogenase
MIEAGTSRIRNKAAKVKESSYLIASISHEKRNVLLRAMAAQIKQDQSAIMHANKIDLESAAKLVQQGYLTEAAVKRLVLTESRLDDITNGIEQVATLPDPLGAVTLARELDPGLNLYKVTCSIGVIAVIFESRPDVLPQVLSLCLKSGNAAILKGGKEAVHTLKQLFESILKALKSGGLKQDIFELLEDRDEVNALLQADRYVDLIIPRGSNELVKYIISNTAIPVLGHAAGVCHIYIDADANLDMALTICLDAKVQYPAACNAVETFLVHGNIASKFLPVLIWALAEQKVEVRCHQNIMTRLDISAFPNVVQATESDWGTEYSNLTVAVKIVDSMEEAILHINRFSSNHTDAIITDNSHAAAKFFQTVDSASVFHNASTRFADGYRYGFGAEVGISNGKLHPRGPVGLEGLITYKYRLMGNGHIVENYTGPSARGFTHRDLGEEAIC